jgi:hypothetical protein
VTQAYAPRWAFVDPSIPSALDALLGPHAADASYRLLCAFLARRTPDEGTTLVGVPCEDINECRGVKPHTGTQEWLDEFCARFGTTFKPEIKPNRKGLEPRVRRVDAAFVAGLKVSPRADARDVYVHVVTGRSIREYDVVPYLPGARDSQRHIMKYHRRLPHEVYPMYPGNVARTLRLIGANDAQERLLTDCTLGRPEYRLSARDTTERLYADGWSNLRKDARHKLVPWLLELDLRCAYMAILERVARQNHVPAPNIAAALHSDDPWAHACQQCGVGLEARANVKAVVNAAAFGAGMPRLREIAGDLPARALASPFVQEVRSVHKRLKDRARRLGYVRGMRGHKYEWSGEDKFGSLLHDLCSEFELCLIDACYEVADRLRGAQCYVSLYQYDGCAVDAPDSLLGTFVNECQAAVAERARALDVHTLLVEKPAPLSISMANAHQGDLYDVEYDLDEAA